VVLDRQCAVEAGKEFPNLHCSTLIAPQNAVLHNRKFVTGVLMYRD